MKRSRTLAFHISSLLFATICTIPGHAGSPHPDADARYFLGPAARDLELKDGADLSGLDLRGMTLYGDGHYYSNVHFDRANLSGADLVGGDILQTKFENCSFREAIMRRVTAKWAGSPAGCDFSDADISGSRIRLDARQLRSTWSYKNKDLAYTSVWMTGSQPGFDFAHFNLRGTRFVDWHLGKGPLFVDADFTDADIREAFIRLTAKQLRSTKNYRAADLGNATLVGDFAGVSFYGFNLRGTTFMCSNLADCNFADSEIRGMNVNGSGYYADRNGEWKTSRDPSASHFTKEQLYSTRNYQRRNLDSVRFTGCDFRDADFSKQTLGLFQDCNLEGAVFTNGDHITVSTDRLRTGRRQLPTGIGFVRCNLSAEQFYSTRAYASKKLQPGCMMAGLDLRGWDFSNFDLRHVIFDNSLVADANFKNARGGDFSHAKGLTVSQVKSMWNYEHDHLKPEPGFSLPREIEIALQADDREGAD